MATERQNPDAIILQTNLSGAIGLIQDDPDSPDANWWTAASNNSDTVAHVSFPTPTVNPTIGADLQQFKIWVKKWDGTGTPTVYANLYENGVSKATVIASANVTSSTGQLFSGTWDANLLGTADGSGVECYIYGTKTGGAPAARATVLVGAVEWNVTYDTAPTSIGDTIQPIWNIRQATFDTSQFIYHIRVALGDTSQYVWNVKGAIGDAIQNVWHIRSLAAQTVQLVHNTLTSIGDTSQYIWDVLTSATAIGDVVELVWHARQAINKTSQSIWNVRATIADTIQSIWHILTPVSDTLQSIWSILTPISDSIQTMWDIRQVIGDTCQSVWDVLGNVVSAARAITLKWNIGIRLLKVNSRCSISQELKMKLLITKPLSLTKAMGLSLRLKGTIVEK